MTETPIWTWLLSAALHRSPGGIKWRIKLPRLPFSFLDQLRAWAIFWLSQAGIKHNITKQLKGIIKSSSTVDNSELLRVGARRGTGKKQKLAAAAWNRCECNLKWNVALHLSVGRWGQEVDVEVVSGQQLGKPVQQIYLTLQAYHIFYCNFGNIEEMIECQIWLTAQHIFNLRFHQWCVLSISIHPSIDQAIYSSQRSKDSCQCM